MQKFIRDILPIQELERRDRRAGRYPTIARLGDKNRRGDNLVFFDDTQTIFYNSASYISLPTTLPVSSSYISSDLKSTISLPSANVTKPGTEQFVVIRSQTELFTPFTETHQYEQDLLTDAFQSGSDITDVGFGFTSRLRDKTILRLELPIKTGIRLVASGGYYYNFKTQTFDAVATPQTTTPTGNVIQIFGNSGGTNIPPLFSCLGTQINRNFQEVLSSQTPTSDRGIALNFEASKSLLQSELYIPSGSISGREFITRGRKIVIEKAVLELPFRANSGWLNDSTQQYVTYDAGGTVYTSVGGPAITVGLLNQITSNRRDVIMSGTIIPANDTHTWTSYQFAGNAFSDNQVARGLGGFTTWSTPTCVVSGSSSFSGSIFVKMDAAVANGLTIMQKDGFGNNVVSANSFGRAMQGLSGRSAFGHDFTQPQNSQTVSYNSLYDLPFTIAANSIQYRLANLDKSSKSPYLFSENDNLAIYVSTPQPALSASGVSTFNGAVTASHDVSIPAGVLYITLYGSEIANSTEFHDTLNQRLETNEAHEAVGFTPTIDQFEVGYTSEYSGSIFDQFKVRDAVSYFGFGASTKLTASDADPIYSNFNSLNDSTSWSSQREWATGKTISEIKKNTRAVTHFSEKELFWDCRVPDPGQVLKFQNNSVVLIGQDIGTPGQVYRMLYTGITSSITSDKGRGLGDFFMTYPYEGKFSNLTTKFTDQLKGDTLSYKNPANPAVFSGFISYDLMLLEVGPPGAKKIYSGGEPTPGPFALLNGMSLPEFIKVFYGIGDGVSSDDNQFVKPRFSSGGYSYTMDIRGWRHGMLSAFPTYSKAIFRHNSYGQFRDMLEQRLDSKYLDTRSNAGRISLLSSPVSVKFVDSAGQVTLPEYTYSSNLSTEVTSSVPYVDGMVRNREDPIALTNLNQSVAII